MSSFYTELINDGHTGTPDADIDVPEVREITTGSNFVAIVVLDKWENIKLS